MGSEMCIRDRTSCVVIEIWPGGVAYLLALQAFGELHLVSEEFVGDRLDHRDIYVLSTHWNHTIPSHDGCGTSSPSLSSSPLTQKRESPSATGSSTSRLRTSTTVNARQFSLHKPVRGLVPRHDQPVPDRDLVSVYHTERLEGDRSVALRTLFNRRRHLRVFCRLQITSSFTSQPTPA